MAVFNVIEADTLGSDTTTWASGTIPTTYDHLYITLSAHGAGGTYVQSLLWQLNGDTGSNYAFANLQTQGGTPASYIQGGTFMGMPDIIGAAGHSGVFGVMKIWMPNYANTANYKQVMFQSYAANYTATSGRWGMKLSAGIWLSTAAITSFSIYVNGGTGFLEGSTYTVYGVNGA